MDITEELGTSSVRLVASEDAEQYFPQLRFLLDHEKDLFEPIFKTEDILEFIRNSTYQMWVGGVDRVEMFALTEVSQSPRCKIVSVAWCSGQNMQPYLAKFMHGVEMYAVIIDADLIQVAGRAAWKKLLAPFGYEFSQIVMSKKVGYDAENTEVNDTDDPASPLS